jgi:hypothetical protein
LAASKIADKIYADKPTFHTHAPLYAVISTESRYGNTRMIDTKQMGFIKLLPNTSELQEVGVQKRGFKAESV